MSKRLAGLVHLTHLFQTTSRAIICSFTMPLFTYWIWHSIQFAAASGWIVPPRGTVIRGSAVHILAIRRDGQVRVMRTLGAPRREYIAKFHKLPLRPQTAVSGNCKYKQPVGGTLRNIKQFSIW